MAGLVGDYVVLRLETRRGRGRRRRRRDSASQPTTVQGLASVSSAVFSLPLLLSCFLSLHPLTPASPVVVLQW